VSELALLCAAWLLLFVAAWESLARIGDRRRASSGYLSPPPPRNALPPLRESTIRRALEARARDELAERLWVLDGYLHVALRGTFVRVPDTTWRS
jgi:hypothetical protein